MSEAAAPAPVVVARTREGVRLASTGATVHWVGGEEVCEFAELRIVHDPDEPGAYYLLYCNGLGEEVTDTWHGTLRSALAQAKFEFSLKDTDWTFISRSRLAEGSVG